MTLEEKWHLRLTSGFHMAHTCTCMLAHTHMHTYAHTCTNMVLLQSRLSLALNRQCAPRLWRLSIGSFMHFHVPFYPSSLPLPHMELSEPLPTHQSCKRFLSTYYVSKLRTHNRDKMSQGHQTPLPSYLLLHSLPTKNRV